MTPGQQLEACLELVEKLAEQSQGIVDQQGRLINAVNEIKARLSTVELACMSLSERTVGLMVAK